MSTPMQIAMRLGPPERRMLELMRSNYSDKRIRAAMMLGLNEALQLSNSLRNALECAPNEGIIEAANRLGIRYRLGPDGYDVVVLS